MIARLNAYSHRIFPPVGSGFYILDLGNKELTPDQQAARKLLSFSNRDFTLLERLSGRKLDIQGQIGHLLLQHRYALEAELASQWHRADFFWRQVLIELKAFIEQDTNWQGLVNAISPPADATVMTDPSQLRQRLLDELFIDTHCAFYNGLVEQKENLVLQDRAFAHIDYIQQYLALIDMSAEAILSLLGEPWQIRINLSVKVKQWHIVIKTCTQRLKHLPSSIRFLNELAEILHRASMAIPKEAKFTLQYWQNIRALKSGIKVLEECRKNYPENLSIFEALDRRILVTPPPPSIKTFVTTFPLLMPISTHCKFGAEPFLAWLFSRQDRRIKLQATFASVLLLMTTGLILREQRVNAVRDGAYRKILVAKMQQDDLGIVENAELFFSDAPLGKDGRNQQVINLYSESLVRWVAQQQEQLDANAQKHLERYRIALNIAKSGGNQP